MSDTLDYLNDESIARELVIKTKACGIFWEQTSPDSFTTTMFEEKDNGIVIVWGLSLYKTNSEFNLDITKNTDYHTSVKSDVLEELYDTLFKINTTVKNKQQILGFIQSVPSCTEPLSLPFKLKPNIDITAAGVGWKRVPANGTRFEKVRENVTIHDGDATYIYDDANSELIMGFDPVPVSMPSDQIYSSIDVEIVVKNISGSPTLDGELMIDVPNQSPMSMPFVTGALDTNYQTINWTWTDSFTNEQINYLKIKFNAIPGINRVTAIQANIS